MAGFEGQRASLELLSLKLPSLRPTAKMPTQSPTFPKTSLDLLVQSSRTPWFPFRVLSLHFLFLGFFNQFCLCGLLPIVSKNIEPDLSLGSLLLGTLARIQVLEMQISQCLEEAIQIPGLKVCVCWVRGFTAAGAQQGGLDLLHLSTWVLMTWCTSILRLGRWEVEDAGECYALAQFPGMHSIEEV